MIILFAIGLLLAFAIFLVYIKLVIEFCVMRSVHPMYAPLLILALPVLVLATICQIWGIR